MHHDRAGSNPSKTLRQVRAERLRDAPRDVEHQVPAAVLDEDKSVTWMPASWARAQEYARAEPLVAKPWKATIRAIIVEQIITLVRQLDLDKPPGEQAGCRPTAAPTKRPRGRLRKSR